MIAGAATTLQVQCNSGAAGSHVSNMALSCMFCADPAVTCVLPSACMLAVVAERAVPAGVH